MYDTNSYSYIYPHTESDYKTSFNHNLTNLKVTENIFNQNQIETYENHHTNSDLGSYHKRNSLNPILNCGFNKFLCQPSMIDEGYYPDNSNSYASGKISNEIETSIDLVI